MAFSSNQRFLLSLFRFDNLIFLVFSFLFHSIIHHLIIQLGNSFAVAIVIASLAGPQWLLTEEKIRNVNITGPTNHFAKDDGLYITKYTKSSLWILCYAQGKLTVCVQQREIQENHKTAGRCKTESIS